MGFPPPVIVEYQGGTIACRGLPAFTSEVPGGARYDERDDCLRFEAYHYSRVVQWLRALQIPHEDKAAAYQKLSIEQRVWQKPFPYQQEALDCWKAAKRRGVVVLPTGAGKSHLALLTLLATQRSTLVVVPTLDLMSQWYENLRSALDIPVGLVGGGENDLQELCVTTYDSAYIQAERLGNRFCFVVYDECHHLPSEGYALAARSCIAPYRLGLTATLERTDGRHVLLDDLIGPVVFRKEITELSGSYLAEYETQTLFVELRPEERTEYDEQRALYKEFLSANGIDMRGPAGFRQFIIESSRSAQGRQAFRAYRRQKDLAMAASAKMQLLDELLHRHRNERTIIFTQDNATAYEISRRFLVPIITHHTKTKERAAVLSAFRSGAYGALVTSKVLNEGVDVPEANIAIVLSGSGSVREHVQRLGRILRRAEGKRAILYEVISASTAEEYISKRRRDHHAYR
jgi:superfamily II DNA or RNA helicase